MNRAIFLTLSRTGLSLDLKSTITNNYKGIVLENPKYAYFLLEICSFILIYLFFGCNLVLNSANLKNILICLLALFLFCFSIDQIAIALNLWTFPAGGTFSFRIFRLPVEEYILFFLASIMIYILLSGIFDE